MSGLNLVPRGLLAALGLLAACAAPPPSVTPLRDTARPVYSNAGFEPRLLAGTWLQVGEVAARPGCAPGGMTVTKTPQGWQADWQLCLNGARRDGQGGVQVTGPGRFQLPGLAPPVWVLWVDGDDRTLVLGTPSGAFGLILDRRGLPADRAKAARDILAWNGYDTALLRLSADGLRH